MEALNEALVNLLVVVVGLVATFLGQKLNAYLKEKGISKQLQNKKGYADIIVNAVQQVYQEANGDEKLAQAKRDLVTMLNQNGVKFTEDELNLLIESAVKGMKDGTK